MVGLLGLWYMRGSRCWGTCDYIKFDLDFVDTIYNLHRTVPHGGSYPQTIQLRIYNWGMKEV